MLLVQVNRLDISMDNDATINNLKYLLYQTKYYTLYKIEKHKLLYKYLSR